MKTKIAFLALILSTIFFYSCSKEKQTENNSDRVKSYTEEFTSLNGNYYSTYNLSYDGENRITAVTAANTPDNRTSFTYHSKDHYSSEIYSLGALQLKQDFFLRSSLLDSTVQINVSKDTVSEKYYYNATNQLIRKNIYDHKYYSVFIKNYLLYTYDAAGKLINSVDYDGLQNVFTYYPDLVYILPVVAPFFKPVEKTNLVKERSVSISGSIPRIIDISYTFDSQNRIQTIKETSDGVVTTKSFTYF